MHSALWTLRPSEGSPAVCTEVLGVRSGAKNSERWQRHSSLLRRCGDSKNLRTPSSVFDLHRTRHRVVRSGASQSRRNLAWICLEFCCAVTLPPPLNMGPVWRGTNYGPSHIRRALVHSAFVLVFASSMLKPCQWCCGIPPLVASRGHAEVTQMTRLMLLARRPAAESCIERHRRTCQDAGSTLTKTWGDDRALVPRACAVGTVTRLGEIQGRQRQFVEQLCGTLCPAGIARQGWPLGIRAGSGFVAREARARLAEGFRFGRARERRTFLCAET